jgi:hypothetical protein
MTPPPIRGWEQIDIGWEQREMYFDPLPPLGKFPSFTIIFYFDCPLSLGKGFICFNES